MPHPRTLAKWYTSVNAKPGFTQEAFNLLKKKEILCSLVFDKMAIRQHIEFDGNDYHGYVNIGCNAQNDSVEIASEALVFMVVGINQRWKIPVGYFFVKHLNANQKRALVEQVFNSYLNLILLLQM